MTDPTATGSLSDYDALLAPVAARPRDTPAQTVLAVLTRGIAMDVPVPAIRSWLVHRYRPARDRDAVRSLSRSDSFSPLVLRAQAYVQASRQGSSSRRRGAWRRSLGHCLSVPVLLSSLPGSDTGSDAPAPNAAAARTLAKARVVTLWVAAEVAADSNGTGFDTVKVTAPRVATIFGWTAPTTRRAIDTAVEMGWLHRSKVRGGGMRLRVKRLPSKAVGDHVWEAFGESVDALVATTGPLDSDTPEGGFSDTLLAAVARSVGHPAWWYSGASERAFIVALALSAGVLPADIDVAQGPARKVIGTDLADALGPAFGAWVAVAHGLAYLTAAAGPAYAKRTAAEAGQWLTDRLVDAHGPDQVLADLTALYGPRPAANLMRDRTGDTTFDGVDQWSVGRALDRHADRTEARARAQAAWTAYEQAAAERAEAVAQERADRKRMADVLDQTVAGVGAPPAAATRNVARRDRRLAQWESDVVVALSGGVLDRADRGAMTAVVRRTLRKRGHSDETAKSVAERTVLRTAASTLLDVILSNAGETPAVGTDRATVDRWTDAVMDLLRQVEGLPVGADEAFTREIQARLLGAGWQPDPSRALAAWMVAEALPKVA